jgi:hypothetical protein
MKEGFGMVKAPLGGTWTGTVQGGEGVHATGILLWASEAAVARRAWFSACLLPPSEAVWSLTRPPRMGWNLKLHPLRLSTCQVADIGSRQA